MGDNLFLSTAEVARHLGCSARHVVNLIHSGTLHAHNIASGKQAVWRILESDLAAFKLAKSTRAGFHPLAKKRPKHKHREPRNIVEEMEG